MKSYYRIYLGKGNVYAQKGFEESFIGVDFGIPMDLSVDLVKADGDWRKFNQLMIPKYLDKYPEKSKTAAGLACGMTHTVCKYLKDGDIVLVPNGKGEYYVGEITGDYIFVPGEDLPHRRAVRWSSKRIIKTSMSEKLQNSLGSIGTTADVSKYAEEIDNLMKGVQGVGIISNSEDIEDPSQFVLEKHLEDFLVANWKQTELGKKYDIYSDNGEIIGQQYTSDTGPIDILAVSKDNKEILVVELKKGRASDVVVGQIQRYMGYVKSELAETNQVVKGVIIAFEKDLRLERALSVTNNIDFYQYEVQFRLKAHKN